MSINININKITQAHNRLHIGDVIVAIQGHDCTNMTHQQSTDCIKMAGNQLNLMVRKYSNFIIFSYYVN